MERQSEPERKELTQEEIDYILDVCLNARGFTPEEQEAFDKAMLRLYKPTGERIEF